MTVFDPLCAPCAPAYGEDGKEWREYWYRRSAAREDWCQRMLAMPEDEFYRRMGIYRPPPPFSRWVATIIRRFCPAFIAQEPRHD